MRSTIVDKIASVAQHNDLSDEVRLSPDIPCEEGVLIAVEVLNSKSRYNVLELTSGRMATVTQGDIVIGALGHRNALHGYSGHLPNELAVGDTVQILNVGGVMGFCDSANPEVGPPFDCKVLGSVLHFPYLGERIGVAARAGTAPVESMDSLKQFNTPVIAMAGTCMDSGKTAAACAIVSRLRQCGLQVAAAKATGVALRRDVLAMQDAGAVEIAIFSDYGTVATTPANGPKLTRRLLTRLGTDAVDAIVLELGDGLLGDYGVDAILADEGIRSKLTAVVLCAGDPVAAWGGAQLLKERYGINPAVVTGPASDNAVGVRQIKEQVGAEAINALTAPTALGDFLVDVVKAEQVA